MRLNVSKLIVATAFVALAACSTPDVSQFGIAPGPLQANEIPMENYAHLNLSARSFDVVNQDLSADKNTGIAGNVDPMPVDILSRYAAQKFTATGGYYNSRFVIQQAQFNVRAVKNTDMIGKFTEGDSQAEMTATISVLLTASRPDGISESVTANTSQVARVSFNASPQGKRKAYLELMARVLDAIDGELAKQIPSYFNDVAYSAVK